MNKHRIASFALAASVFGTAAVGTVSGVSAQQTRQQGGAAGLVAAVAQIVANVDDVVDVNVVDSFNNLQALNNVLRNSPILSGIDITVQDIDVVIADNQVLTDFLNNNNIAIDDVVGVALLSGGDFIIFV